MSYREFHYRWQFDLESSPEELWPLVSDTNRFNRDTGVPSVESPQLESKQMKNARRLLRLSVLGVPVEWEEQPFEWVRPSRFGVVRRYIKGPISELRVLAELSEREAGAARELDGGFGGELHTGQRDAGPARRDGAGLPHRV